uniref:ATP synthase subunit a n=1 Tax=Colpocephalum eucarenum TaxID=2965266 RepID=A0A9Y1YSA3_9NEOP|nr:ATP synthase F0 subunit 6 [Colpocephalum eucarenum]WIM51515.1 ATP synthase subunit 6 [Colpocephalum eucarenum]
MTSLLSTFDPCSNLLISNWIFLFILIVIFPMSSFFWKSLSLVQQGYFILVEVLTSLFNNKMKTELMFVSVFLFLLMINLSGLIPYGFSLTSHYSFNFSLGLTLWLSTMIWGFSKNLNSNIAHLTPMGCPLGLVPFMVLVESISMLIRPITLSLRLMSNMLAGHMIISLLCGACYSMSFLLKPSFFLLEIGFLMFELGVAFIQTYVFSMLMSLYWEETE